LKAVKSNRCVEVIFFNGQTETVRVNGTQDLEAFFNALSSDPTGGTNMGYAMEEAKKAMPELKKPQALMVSDMQIPPGFEVEPKLDCRLELVLVSDVQHDKERIKEQIGANDVMVIDPTTIGTDHRHSLASNIVERV
jgi:Mg-chelatase subunit ChlD